MLARVVARLHPLLWYVIAFALFTAAALASEPVKPEWRGALLNTTVLIIMGAWICAVWAVTLQAYDDAAVFGFHLGPRIALLAAGLLSVGGAYLYAVAALYVMFSWRTAEGLVRAAERSTQVSILETAEMFVLLVVPPVGVWLLRGRILRAAQRGQIASQRRKTDRVARKAR